MGDDDDEGRLDWSLASQVSGEEYRNAKPDPIYQFSAPVAGHMNADHADATAAIVRDVVGITVSKADILAIDRLGMTVRCERDGQSFKARVPFSRCAVWPFRSHLCDFLATDWMLLIHG